MNSLENFFRLGKSCYKDNVGKGSGQISGDLEGCGIAQLENGFFFCYLCVVYYLYGVVT